MSGDGRTYDPICGKRVERDGSRAAEYKHRTYFFCSPRCKERFEKRAERLRVHDLAKMGALFAHSKVRWGIA